MCFYNWTDNTIMTVSSSKRPFCASKEMHPLTLEALIGACLKLKSFVVDFATIATIATLTLGSQPRPGLARVRAKKEAQELHLMLLGV